MLEGLGLTEEQFIDMCILCGCDYCGTIRGEEKTRSQRKCPAHLQLNSIHGNLVRGLSIPHSPLHAQIPKSSMLAPGVGQKRALELVQKHGSLEKVMENLDSKKYGIPEPFPYQEARQLFKGALSLATDPST